MATPVRSALQLSHMTKADFYAAMQPGDIAFFEGRYLSSHLIQTFTSSPWSHLGTLELIHDRWFILEAIAEHGVRWSRFEPYIEGYQGNVALARRPCMTDDDRQKELTAGLDVLDDSYNLGECCALAAHRLLSAIPVKPNGHEFICSTLKNFMSQATGNPLFAARYVPTPGEIWTHATVQPVGVYIPGI